ncbi:MAG TPA: bifunctional hydroxymethylpyrimidine kinase/phosphomethylpyrimidine kinase [Rhodospirillales bacterium]|nr:bifunctional hydroxymethylpyrimidine kinase/phosphomethylpyrimidine kinase [Rhodospirillales bacterium]
MQGRVLIVAGSDSGGGAGIQADIKTVTVLGGFAMTAVTALTAQNTEGVSAIHEVPLEFVAQQMRVVLGDIGADCIKLGMLHRPDVIEAVAAVLDAEAAGVPLVVDPVMVAKGGAALLAPEAMNSLKERIVPRAAILTPNLPEAEALTGLAIADVDAMKRAGTALLALGPDAVLLKGGHLEGEVLTDLLFAEGGVQAFEGPRIATTSTHGTGCTLASAVAAGLAQGMRMIDAVTRARDYVRRAIETAPGLGHGHGPLNHAHPVTPFSVKK